MKVRARVVVFPAWRGNPYLNVMSLASRAAGYEFTGITTYDSLLKTLGQLRPGDVFHLHWTSPILQNAVTQAEAISRLEIVVERLRRLRNDGVAMVWTIHNRLPHELRFRDEEIELHRALASAANAIHIMNPATPEVLSPICKLPPEKIRVIPHPTYEGTYSSQLDRASARASFDLAPEDFAVLFLGQIRPYKGLDKLIGALDAYRGDRPPVLMLAGVVKETTVDAIREMIPDNLRAILHLEFVDDSDIARWLSAADVLALPYEAILNSGSAHLAATYHVPVILPDEPHVRATFGAESWVHLFDTAVPHQSIASVLEFVGAQWGKTARAFDRFGEDRSPWVISGMYLELLDQLTQTMIRDEEPLTS